MKDYYALDIETYDEVNGKLTPVLDTNKFKLGMILDKDNKERYFYTPKQMREYMLQTMKEAKSKTYWWAHNHEYDFYGIWKDAMKEMITTGEMNIISTRPFICIINKKHYLIDLMSFYHFALKDVGEMIGLPKLEMPEEPRNIEEIKPYLFRDCAIIIRAIEHMTNTMKELGFSPRKYITASTLSMNCFISYLSKHSKAGWIINKGRIHKNLENLDFTRQANRGGYNQAFQTGNYKNCTCIDINSSYWKAMTQIKFPDLLKERRLYKEDIDAIPRETLLNTTSIINAKVKVPNTNVGILGIRYKPSDKSIYQQFFPREKMIIKGTWTNIELKYAIENGYEIIDMYEAVIWTNDLQFNVLSDYIKILWKKRKNSESKVTNHFLKLLGNGLYGKLMQRKKDKEYKWVKRQDVDKYTSNGWRIESANDEYCISREGEEYIPKYISLILGCLITAQARINLVKEMKKIKEEDLLYCDTDSIIYKGEYDIDIGDELGQWKIEERGDARINGEKKYYIGDKVKIAGLMKRDTKKELLDEEISVNTKRMIGFRQAIHFGGFERTGTFENITKVFEVDSKINRILPEELTEVRI